MAESSIVESLASKLDAFAAELEADERTLLNALVARGVADRDDSEVEGYGLRVDPTSPRLGPGGGGYGGGGTRGVGGGGYGGGGGFWIGTPQFNSADFQLGVSRIFPSRS